MFKCSVATHSSETMGRSVRSKRAQHNREALRKKVYNKVAENHIKAAAERLQGYLAEAKLNEPMTDAAPVDEVQQDVEMQPKDEALSLKKKIEKRKKAKKKSVLGHKITKKNRKKLLKTRF